jgi:RNA polymerase sigma factor (sigma-70 family)
MEFTQPLTIEQYELVEKNLDIVKWAIFKHIEVNKNIYGFEYADLYQEGCLLLCHAAVKYDGELAQFGTFANIVVKNGLLDYCRSMCGKQKRRQYFTDFDSETGTHDISSPHYDEAPYNERISETELDNLFCAIKKQYTGVALLGVQALELKVKGYSGADIAKMWGVKQNHIGAWISRAKAKLRRDKQFIFALQD